MRGRKPTPTFLKLVTGNPGRRPLNDAEPVAPPNLPEPPAFLSPVAVAEWQRLGRELADANLLANLDRNLFASYCVYYDLYCQAFEDMKTAGRYMRRGSGGLATSKPLEQMMLFEKRMTALATEFGLSPSSRSRIRVDDKKPKDEFEQYLNRGPGKAPL